MRKTFIFYFIIIFTAVVLSNCSKAPVYPDTPEIEFESMQWYSAGDSLLVTIKFKDGDGDLGLSGDEMSYPYQEYDFAKDNNGNYIKYGSSPSLPPLACKNYVYTDIDFDGTYEYVLINYNYNHFNYFVDVYVKQTDDSFVKFDFQDTCPDYNGRFPLLNDLDQKGPIEGDLTYSIKYLYDGFPNQTIKLKITIQDRVFHKSNTIETPEVLLN